MRAPEFWTRGGLLPLLLAPAALAWRGVAALRRQTTTPVTVGAPVICVGNLTAGGAGKTPVVLSLVARLAAMGRRPHVLSRGYGGRLKGPLRVDLTQHRARDVGDEPLLIARRAPVWIGADRVATARLAIAAGADCLVMDDGFQSPALAKTLSLLVVDAGYGLGNGRVMPAGPLREPAAAGLARADAVILIGDDDAGLARRLAASGRPVLAARLEPALEAATLEGQPVYAFAGIGRPQKFYDTLAALGARVVGTRDFADHHAFDPIEVMEMIEASHERHARLVTTEKDWVRLDADGRMMVDAIAVELAFADDGAVDRLLAEAVEAGR